MRCAHAFLLIGTVLRPSLHATSPCKRTPVALDLDVRIPAVPLLSRSLGLVASALLLPTSLGLRTCERAALGALGLEDVLCSGSGPGYAVVLRAAVELSPAFFHHCTLLRLRRLNLRSLVKWLGGWLRVACTPASERASGDCMAHKGREVTARDEGSAQLTPVPH